MEMELVKIDVADVVVKKSLREELGDLTTLENSIKRHGLLFPIFISRRNVLISGRRRLEACRNIGVSPIYALKVDVEPGSMEASEIQSEENLCRLPLSPDEFDKEIRAKKSLRKPGKRLAKKMKGLFGK